MGGNVTEGGRHLTDHCFKTKLMALHGLLLPLRKLSVNIKEVKSKLRREIVIWRLENSQGNNRNQLMIAQSIRMKGVHFKKKKSAGPCIFLSCLSYFHSKTKM